MYIFREFTLGQYLTLIVVGSIIGVFLGEFLMNIFKSVKIAIEELETRDGSKKIFIGVMLLIMPFVVKIGLYVTEIELALFFPKVWTVVEYMMLAYFIIGAINLIRGFTTFILAFRHGRC